MAADQKWDDPIFVDSLPPEQRAQYDAETERLAEEWEREEAADLTPEKPDQAAAPQGVRSELPLQGAKETGASAPSQPPVAADDADPNRRSA